jgi:hypothetical protein
MLCRIYSPVYICTIGREVSFTDGDIHLGVFHGIALGYRLSPSIRNATVKKSRQGYRAGRYSRDTRATKVFQQHGGRSPPRHCNGLFFRHYDHYHFYYELLSIYLRWQAPIMKTTGFQLARTSTANSIRLSSVLPQFFRGSGPDHNNTSRSKTARIVTIPASHEKVRIYIPIAS